MKRGKQKAKPIYETTMTVQQPKTPPLIPNRQQLTVSGSLNLMSLCETDYDYVFVYHNGNDMCQLPPPAENSQKGKSTLSILAKIAGFAYRFI